jgi:hypothetical protein
VAFTGKLTIITYGLFSIDRSGNNFTPSLKHHTMNTDLQSRREWRRNHRNSDSGRVLTGAFLLIAGAVLFLKNLDTGLPGWLFSWQMFLIGLGVFFGLKNGFRGPVWLILILIGGFSLQPEVFPFIHLRIFTWPAILVILGIYFIVKPRSRERNLPSDLEPFQTTRPGEEFMDGDKLDITSILGSVKKVVVSKNFQGGEIVSVLGGSDINLTQADIHGKVRLEATNVMGGTKLIIPPTWDVKSELVAIFGGVEDKRDIRSANIDPNKVLVLEGTCLFGGIEIKSF